MKKTFYLLCFTLVILAGCKKSSFQPFFDEKPEERLGKAIALVNTELISAENGWIATLPTFAGGGFSFYMTFDSTETVTMYSDISNSTATTPSKSTYRVAAGLGASLIFDTYSHLARLRDPSPSFGGQQGKGYSSDVEFTYVRSTADSLILVGREFRQPLVMVRATAEQKTAYENAGLKTAIDNLKSFFAKNKQPYIEIESDSTISTALIKTDFTNDLQSGKRVTFSGVLADGTEVIRTAKYVFTLDGIWILDGGLVFNGITFVGFLYKNATSLVLVDAAGKEYIFKEPPLWGYIGNDYQEITVPNSTTGEGWGDDFVTKRAEAANRLVNGKYKTRLERMLFSFDPKNRIIGYKGTVMKLKIYTRASTSLNATFSYGYTVSPNGIFKFDFLDGDSWGDRLESDLEPLLKQRINVDTFNIEYFTDAAGNKLAQFRSIENPTFTFTGTLE